jgi:6-phosphofructokinase 1
MEAVGVTPAPVAAPEKKKLLDLKDPFPAAAAANGGAKASPAAKWAMKKKLVGGDAGYVLEDVPHLTDYMPQLPVRSRVPHPLGVSRWVPDG